MCLLFLPETKPAGETQSMQEHMESAAEPLVISAAGFANLTKLQKLAGLLLLLAPENAAVIMKQLDEHEVEEVSSEMARFPSIGQELQVEILREFSPVAVEASTAVFGGVDRTRTLLEKSLGVYRAADIISRVAPTRQTVAAMEQIVELEVSHIFNLVRDEQLQTIALVTSYMSPEKASELLSMVRPELRQQIIERLAAMAPTSIDVVETVAESLQRKTGSRRVTVMNQTGGINKAAEVLNALPKNISKSILSSLAEHNAELGDLVRKKMFTFEELALLDTMSLQKVLQEVDLKTLTVALKTASERVKNTILSTLSKRGAENVREEMSFLGPLKLSRIEAAQQEIIDVVGRLENDEEIDLTEIRQRARQ